MYQEFPGIDPPLWTATVWKERNNALTVRADTLAYSFLSGKKNSVKNTDWYQSGETEQADSKLHLLGFHISFQRTMIEALKIRFESAKRKHSSLF